MRYLLVVLAALIIGLAACAPSADFTKNVDRATQLGNETAAIQTIKTLHTAQVQYSFTYGRYAKSLVELGPPSSGTPSESGADLIPADLVAGKKFGFKFALSGDGIDYQIHAAPEIFDGTGSRTFFSDKSMVVRENKGSEPATANSKELEAKQ